MGATGRNRRLAACGSRRRWKTGDRSREEPGRRFKIDGWLEGLTTTGEAVHKPHGCGLNRRSSATFWTAPSLRKTRAEPARPKHKVELAALHALFEYAESHALAHVEHSINAVVGLPQLFGRADLGCSESLQLVAEGGVIGRRVLVRQPHESLRELLAFLLVRSADFLEGLQLRDKLPILLVAELKHFLSLDERVRIEQSLDLQRGEIASTEPGERPSTLRRHLRGR